LEVKKINNPKISFTPKDFTILEALRVAPMILTLTYEDPEIPSRPLKTKQELFEFFVLDKPVITTEIGFNSAYDLLLKLNLIKEITK